MLFHIPGLRTSVLLIAILSLSSSLAIGADDYPSRPIKLMVGAYDQRDPLSQAAVRSGDGLHADQHDRDGAEPAGRYPALPAQDLSALIALAKAKPDTLSIAIGGIGSSLHLAGEQLKLMADVRILNVPYKGTAPALTDVLGGQVDMMFISLVCQPAWRLRSATARACRDWSSDGRHRHQGRRFRHREVSWCRCHVASAAGGSTVDRRH